MKNTNCWMVFTILPLLMLVINFSSAQEYNYGEVLQKSLFFYEAQQSGKLPDWNRVSWRGDANVNDGQMEGIDVSGGWHDAGDHIKFGLPMAFSVTALNWGFLEYQQAYIQSNQDEIFKNNIRWVTDYFIKCHIGPTEFVAQVSDKSTDHSLWAAAELTELYTTRKSYSVTAANPGTDVVCETAAALASASIVFKDSDPAYSAKLIDHAISLYNFGDQYRGFYTGAVPADCCYPSGNYVDELVWGALWLYKATGDIQYLQKAEAEYDNMINNPAGRPVDYLWSLVWEDKSYGSFVLLSMLTDNQKYKDDAERHLNFWTDEITYSPGGQAWLFQWGSLRHSANAALTAFIYADNVATPNKAKYINFGERQINYILGDNPDNRSYVIGFGNNPPQNPHHRSAHGSWEGTDRGLPIPAAHTLYGALVGGPGAADDQHTDVTTDFQENEVAVDYNACFQGAIARMQQVYGGTPLANFPVDEVPDRAEIFSSTKLNSLNATSATISMDVSNYSAWPARTLTAPSVRYYMDISESVAAGYSINDYDISLSFGEGGATFAGPVVVDAAANTYYVEVTWASDVIIAPAGYNNNAKEAQIQIRVNTGVPFDLGNDWSGSDLTSTAQVIANIPIYEGGILVGGQEPGPVGPSYTITASAQTGGTISPNGVVTVAEGGSRTFIITANNGFEIDNVTVNGDTVGAVASYTFTNVQSDGTIVASFAEVIVPTYTITAAAGAGGSISPVGSVVVSEGNDQVFTISPDPGFVIDDVLVNGVSVGNVATYTFANVISDQTISASFIAGNQPPVARASATPVSGAAPLTVDFDGSGSTDPEGDALTYSWDFGDGTVASGVTATHMYALAGNYTVILTVTDVSGGVGSDTIAISVTGDGGPCAFDTPRPTPLPTGHTSFDHIFVIGTGGPDLSNVSNFTINWDLENNGLWQFSMNTNNGIPSWWNDLRANVTYRFSSPQPDLSFVNTGFQGMDGDYYVTWDNGNFVMVSKTADFTIYCSTTATPPDCSVSNARKLAGGSSVVSGTRGLSVYPNPFNESIQIALPDRRVESITVFDATGKEMLRINHEEISDRQVVELSPKFKKGLYMLHVEGADWLEVLKVLKN